MAPSVVLSVRVPVEVAEALDRHAYALQISRTDLLRELIEITMLLPEDDRPGRIALRIQRLLLKHFSVRGYTAQILEIDDVADEDSDLPLVALNPIFPGHQR